jgi:hypothetical protein
MAAPCYNHENVDFLATEPVMILPAALALGVHLMTPVSDSVPVLNIEQVCTGIARQGGVTFHDPAIAREKKDCLESEEEVRKQLVKQWTSFLAADRNACVSEAETGGESSYTELLTCLEMARDVRNIGKEPAEPTGGAKAKTRPAK